MTCSEFSFSKLVENILVFLPMARNGPLASQKFVLQTDEHDLDYLTVEILFDCCNWVLSLVENTYRCIPFLLGHLAL